VIKKYCTIFAIKARINKKFTQIRKIMLKKYGEISHGVCYNIGVAKGGNTLY
jgi:hypothetical protein